MRKTGYIRECPNCHSEIIYDKSQYYKFNYDRRVNNLCENCAFKEKVTSRVGKKFIDLIGYEIVNDKKTFYIICETCNDKHYYEDIEQIFAKIRIHNYYICGVCELKEKIKKYCGIDIVGLVDFDAIGWDKNSPVKNKWWIKCNVCGKKRYFGHPDKIYTLVISKKKFVCHDCKIDSTVYTRECPTCGKTLTYKNKFTRDRAEKENWHCQICAKQIRHN